MRPPASERLLRALLPLLVLIALIAGTVYVLGTLGYVDLGFIIRVSPFLAQGVAFTLAATAVILPLSIVLGFFVGWGRIGRNPVGYWVSTLFVDVLRGTPQLVVVLVGFFVIAPLFVAPIDLRVFAFWAGTFALAFHSAAYQAEIFRNGFQSVPSGQIEAAHALGLTSWQTMREIILPQAVRVSLPPLGNEFANIVKDSSIISFLGILTLFLFQGYELTGWGRQFQGFEFNVNTLIFSWVIIAILYFFLIYVLTMVMLALERRMQVPGLEEAF